jgi:NADH-quinone oxidoreductase subunit I
VTELYPEVRPALPERSRGVFEFHAEKCTSCELCVNACPNGVLKVNFHKNESGKRIVDRYRMSRAYCLFCGLCTEACPTDAINFTTAFEMSVYDKDECNLDWPGVSENPVQTEKVV